MLQARLAALLGAGAIRMMHRLALFAYGSLVNLESVERTIGRPVERSRTVRLAGWRRRWSQARDNLAAEKTFALPNGDLPSHCLGLNLERGAGEGPNGVLLGLAPAELDRMDTREIRYDRIEVTGDVVADGPLGFDRVVTYVAKPENFASAPPEGAVILASYLRAVEAAIEALGPGQLELFRETTGPPPVEVVEGALVRGEIPPGNPRAW